MKKFSLDQLRETVNRFFLRLAAIPQGSGKGGKKEGSVRNETLSGISTPRRLAWACWAA